MLRVALTVVLLACACGTTEDNRPKTVEYITAAILAPTCGAAQCHSTFRGARGYVFDTVPATRRTLINEGMIIFDSKLQYDPSDPAGSRLIKWVTETDPEGLGIGRMPFDAPMPNADIKLLEAWIADGAPGAQCDPGANSGMACNNKTVVQCNADWTFGPAVMDCSAMAKQCSQGVCQ